MSKQFKVKGVNGDTTNLPTDEKIDGVTPLENNPPAPGEQTTAPAITTPIADVEVVVTPPVVSEEPNTQEQAKAFAEQNQGVLDLNAMEAQMPTPTTKHLVSSVRKYLADMHPTKSQTPQTCASGLGSLWRILSTTFNNLTDEEFQVFYPKFLDVVHANGDNAEKPGAFSLRYVLRGIEDVNLSTENLEAVQRLLNVVINTADSASRKHAVQNFNWERALQMGLTEDARVRLLTFYGV